MKSSRIAWLVAVAVVSGCTSSTRASAPPAAADSPAVAATEDTPSADPIDDGPDAEADPEVDPEEEPAEDPGDEPSEDPSPTPTPQSTVKSTWDLGNGRFPAYLTLIDGPHHGLRVDVIQWLTGDAANEAATEDGSISAGDTVPNDYYIRNVNPKLRTVPVAAGAPITVNVLAAIAGESDNSSADVKRSWKKFATYADLDLRNLVFWLTVKGGVVTKLEEQYQP